MIAKLKAAVLAALLSAFCGAAGAQFTQNTGYFAAGGGGGGDGSITIGAAISGSCTSGYLLYNNAGVIGCLQAATVTGTPAAGDLSYWTSSSAQALLTAAASAAGNVLQSAGTGAAPVWSSTTMPTGVGTARVMQVIAEGATAHNFGDLATGSCETITTAATGTATTDVIDITFNADISGVTGFGGAGTALTLYKWPTANNINIRACNFTGGADINASSVTINWKVIR